MYERDGLFNQALSDLSIGPRQLADVEAQPINEMKIVRRGVHSAALYAHSDRNCIDDDASQYEGCATSASPSGSVPERGGQLASHPRSAIGIENVNLLRVNSYFEEIA